MRDDVLRCSPHSPVDLALGFLARPAVTGLKGSDQLVGLALDAVQIVVGELAPPRLRLAACLLPPSCEYIGLHAGLLTMRFVRRRGQIPPLPTCENVRPCSATPPDSPSRVRCNGKASAAPHASDSRAFLAYPHASPGSSPRRRDPVIREHRVLYGMCAAGMGSAIRVAWRKFSRA